MLVLALRHLARARIAQLRVSRENVRCFLRIRMREPREEIRVEQFLAAQGQIVQGISPELGTYLRYAPVVHPPHHGAHWPVQGSFCGPGGESANEPASGAWQGSVGTRSPPRQAPGAGQGWTVTR